MRKGHPVYNPVDVLPCINCVVCLCSDVAQNESLCGWNAHDGEVFNVQFSSDETSVYSMGRDNKFCQWSINRSGQKVTEFNVHEKACEPTGGSVRGEYFPNTPRGNLFAFESEDKYVLTCSPKEAIVYQVRGSYITATCA